jgi:1,4-dihydroxy-2-naphthoyl-CoA hydrolase
VLLRRPVGPVACRRTPPGILLRVSETSSNPSAGTPTGSLGLDIAGRFVEHLGVDVVEATGDKVVATWVARPELHQPYGIVHGGVHCSVIETLASIGAAFWFADQQPDGKVVGVNNNTDFYRAVREGTLTSTATPLHRGRSQQVWVVETVDAERRTAARGQVRLQNLTA